MQQPVRRIKYMASEVIRTQIQITRSQRYFVLPESNLGFFLTPQETIQSIKHLASCVGVAVEE